MGEASAALRQLRPVTFRYKKPYDDGSKPIQYGLIAEEVAEVLPDLVVFNADGKPETVAYHLLPSFLLAEYQRQQTSVELQERGVEQLQQTVQLQAEQIERQQKIIQTQAEQMDVLRQDVDSLKALLARSLQGAAQHAQR